MSKLDWGGVLALGIVIGGGLAVISMTWFVGLNYCPNSPCEYDQAGGNHERYYSYDPPLAVGPNTTSIFDEADNKRHDDYYVRQDLRAQEVMSRATNSMAITAFLSLITAVVGMVLLLRTLVLQRENNEIADRIAKHELRPYLAFTSTKITRNQVGGWCAAITIKNVGHTIAKGIERKSGQYVGPVIPDEEMNEVFPKTERMPDIGPQQENTWRFDITPEMLRVLNDKSGEATQLRYGGAVLYSDSFAGNHALGFEFRTLPGDPIGREECLLNMSTKGNYST